MNAIISQAPSVNGTLTFPADKAICHRAALLCALSRGSTVISPWSTAEDCQHTLAGLTQLGVDIRRTEHGVQVQGRGFDGLRAPAADLYCGDSGTTMRLTAGILAGQPFESRLTAGASLAQRPMRRIVEPLARMGADIEGASCANRDCTPPLRITGRRPLRALTYTLPVASAQVKSAVLLAGLFADGPTTVVEPVATRDHTERLLKRLGADVRRDGQSVTVTPPQGGLMAPEQLTIPGDFSSAAFFLVAASILPGSRLVLNEVGLNPTRSRLIEVLQRMGGSIGLQVQNDGWEPRGTIIVEHRPLRGVRLTASEVPALIDELPILMVAACAAEGETSFESVGELRVKETDRLRAMTDGLRQFGARLDASGGTGVRIRTSALHGAQVDSCGDHRTAMSLAVAGLLADGRTVIRGAECVGKSLGSFFELLRSVAGPNAVKTD